MAITETDYNETYGSNDYQAPDAAQPAPAVTAPEYEAPAAAASPEYDSSGLLGKSVSDINTLTSGSGPLMRGADTRAKQAAQERGLLSSSMAIGAAEAERLNTVMPLVQQQADIRGQKTLQKGQQDWQSGESALGREHEVGMLGKEQDWRSGESALGREQETSMAEFDAATSMGLSKQDYEQRTLLASQANAFDVERENAIRVFEAEQAGLDRELQTAITDTEIAARLGLSEQEYKQQVELSKQANTFAAAENALSRSHEVTMQIADAATRESLVNLEQKWNQDIQQDVNLAAFWQSSVDGLMDIMNNAELTPEQQQNAMNEMVGYTDFDTGEYHVGTVEAGLNFLSNLSGDSAGTGAPGTVDGFNSIGIETNTTGGTIYDQTNLAPTGEGNDTITYQQDNSALEARMPADLQQQLSALGPEPIVTGGDTHNAWTEWRNKKQAIYNVYNYQNFAETYA